MSVRIGAIGLGALGRIDAQAYERIDDATLVAGADVAEDVRTAFADEFGVETYADYEDMLDSEDLDAVNIVTPHTLHHEMARAALERGLHVLVEKPMVTTTADARDLVDLADERERVLQIGYQRHFHPTFVEMKRRIDAGDIGHPHMVSGHITQEWITTHQGSWRVNPDLSGGGQLFDSGSHLLDALLWVTGAEPERVAATMDYQDNDVDVNSALAVDLSRDGTPVTASVGVSGDGVNAAPDETITVVGTEGQLTYRDGDLFLDDGDDRQKLAVEETEYGEKIRRNLANFVDAILGEAEPAVPGEFGVRVTALTEAAYEADERGERVAVDLS
jgi:predicted dehydrogenase